MITGRPRKSDDELRAELKNTRNMLYAERDKVKIYKKLADDAVKIVEECACAEKIREAERAAGSSAQEKDERAARANAAGADYRTTDGGSAGAGGPQRGAQPSSSAEQNDHPDQGEKRA